VAKETETQPDSIWRCGECTDHDEADDLMTAPIDSDGDDDEQDGDEQDDDEQDDDEQDDDEDDDAALDEVCRFFVC
jgi:hypothetical protein